MQRRNQSFGGAALVQFGAVDDGALVARARGGEEVHRQVGVRDVERRLQCRETGFAIRTGINHLIGGQFLADVDDDAEQRVA